DAEGVVCLPNEEIFAGLAQMGYEKPSTKLTFYKAFFSSQWKFLIHTLLQSLSAKRTSWNEFSTAMASANHIGDLLTYTTRYISPALTQKVFANMRWVGKGFSGVETPLFEGMLAARQLAEEEQSSPPQQPQSSPQAPPQGAEFPTQLFQQVLDTCSALTRRIENLEHDKAAQKLEIIKLKARVKRLERANKGRMIDDLDKDKGIELVVDQVKDDDTAETEGRHATEQAEKQPKIYHLDLDHPSKVLSMQEDDSEVQEVVKVVTTAKLITEVVTAATSQVSTASTTIFAAKPSIPVAAPTVTAAYTRRRNGDKGKGILIKTPKPMKKKDQIELDAEYARKLHEEINKDHEEINKDIDWDAAIDHVKQKSKENPQYIK
nr:hypothetical protein [Tanacetum cinerariifolium]